MKKKMTVDVKGPDNTNTKKKRRKSSTGSKKKKNSNSRTTNASMSSDLDDEQQPSTMNTANDDDDDDDDDTNTNNNTNDRMRHQYYYFYGSTDENTNTNNTSLDATATATATAGRRNHRRRSSRNDPPIRGHVNSTSIMSEQESLLGESLVPTDNEEEESSANVILVPHHYTDSQQLLITGHDDDDDDGDLDDDNLDDDDLDDDPLYPLLLHHHRSTNHSNNINANGMKTNASNNKNNTHENTMNVIATNKNGKNNGYRNSLGGGSGIDVPSATIYINRKNTDEDEGDEDDGSGGDWHGRSQKIGHSLIGLRGGHPIVIVMVFVVLLIVSMFVCAILLVPNGDETSASTTSTTNNHDPLDGHNNNNNDNIIIVPSDDPTNSIEQKRHIFKMPFPIVDRNDATTNPDYDKNKDDNSNPNEKKNNANKMESLGDIIIKDLFIDDFFGNSNSDSLSTFSSFRKKMNSHIQAQQQEQQSKHEFIFPFPTGAFWINFVLPPPDDDDDDYETMKNYNTTANVSATDNNDDSDDDSDDMDNEKFSYPIAVYPYSYKWSDSKLALSYPFLHRTVDKISISDNFFPDLILGTKEDVIQRNIIHFDSLSVSVRFTTSSTHSNKKLKKAKPTTFNTSSKSNLNQPNIFTRIKNLFTGSGGASGNGNTGSWESYLVQGSPYSTIKYNNVIPTIQALSSFNNVICPKELFGKNTSYKSTSSYNYDDDSYDSNKKNSSNNSRHLLYGVCILSNDGSNNAQDHVSVLRGVQFVLQTEEGLNWIMFASEPITLLFDTKSKTKVFSKTTFNGIIRLAVLPPQYAQSTTGSSSTSTSTSSSSGSSSSGNSNHISSISSSSGSTNMEEPKKLQLSSSSGLRRLIYHAGIYPVAGEVSWDFHSLQSATKTSSLSSSSTSAVSSTLSLLASLSASSSTSSSQVPLSSNDPTTILEKKPTLLNPSRVAKVQFSFTTKLFSENLDSEGGLLMLALPHHVHAMTTTTTTTTTTTFSSSTSGGNSNADGSSSSSRSSSSSTGSSTKTTTTTTIVNDNYGNTNILLQDRFDLKYECIKGAMRPIVGNSWSYDEPLLPIGFDGKISTIENLAIFQNKNIRKLLYKSLRKDFELTSPTLQAESTHDFGKQIARLAQLAHITGILNRTSTGNTKTIANTTSDTIVYYDNDDDEDFYEDNYEGDDDNSKEGNKQRMLNGDSSVHYNSTTTSKNKYDTLIKVLSRRINERLFFHLESFLNSQASDLLVYDENIGGVTSKDGLMNQEADSGSGRYNDHHIHFGYILYSCAILGRLNSTFANQYRDHVDAIYFDIAYNANAGSKSYNGLYFPLARHMSWFDGHSFGSGLVQVGKGKSQANSSEAVNAYYGAYLWSLVRHGYGTSGWGRGLIGGFDFSGDNAKKNIDDPSLDTSESTDFTRLLLAMEVRGAKTYWHMMPPPPTITPTTVTPSSSLLEKVTGQGKIASNSTLSSTNLTVPRSSTATTAPAPATELSTKKVTTAINRRDDVYDNALFTENYMVGNLGMLDVVCSTGLGTEKLYVHMSNFLPVTGTTRELFSKDYVAEEYKSLFPSGSSINETEMAWRGYVVSDHAIIDPGSAWEEAKNLTSSELESGVSKSQILFFILSDYGGFDISERKVTSTNSSKENKSDNDQSLSSSSCDKYPACVISGVTGNCCPTADGNFLYCCNQ